MKKKIEKKIKHVEETLIKSYQIFYEIAFLDEILNNERSASRRNFQKASQAYQSIFPDYLEAKEVSEITTKKNYYYEIIKSEKNKLKIHLKYFLHNIDKTMASLFRTLRQKNSPMRSNLSKTGRRAT